MVYTKSTLETTAMSAATGLVFKLSKYPIEEIKDIVETLSELKNVLEQLPKGQEIPLDLDHNIVLVKNNVKIEKLL